MGLESATYINQLVATNPTSGDPKSEGDNHVRLLKSTIQASFPNINGPMTASPAELNILDGATLSTSELNTLTGITATVDELNVLDGVTITTAQLNGTGAVFTDCTANTPTLGDSSTKLATTAFVQANFTDNAYPPASGNSGLFLTNDGTNAAWEGVPDPENLLINTDFEVNQESYTSGVITTGEYGHDMWKSISSANYTVSDDALTLVSGTLGQSNEDLVAADGETVYMSVESGSITIGATAGAVATTITPSNPYSWTLDVSDVTDFVTITAATAAKGIRIGRRLGGYVKPEPRAEEGRCNYYYWKFSSSALNLLGTVVTTTNAQFYSSAPVMMKSGSSFSGTLSGVYTYSEGFISSSSFSVSVSSCGGGVMIIYLNRTSGTFSNLGEPVTLKLDINGAFDARP
jgi:hypothetical protein